MVETVATNAKYQEFEQKHARHLNMLQENVSYPKQQLTYEPYRTETLDDRHSLSSRKSWNHQHLMSSSTISTERSWSEEW